MYLGKTVQAIGVINAVPAIRRVLVVCPASLKINWCRELKRWLVRRYRIGVAAGRMWPGLADIVVTNYDILSKHAEKLYAREWDLVILDEVHYCKNPKAQRTQAVWGERKWDASKRQWNYVNPPIPAARILALTGTPIVNRPEELFPIIAGLDPDRWRSFWSYAKEYCAAKQVFRGKRMVWDTTGASNLPKLQEILRTTIMVRRLKADVLTDLPPKQRQVIELPADDAESVIARENAAWDRHEAKLAELRAAVELAKAEDDATYEAAVFALRSGTEVAFTEISEARHATALAKVPLVVEHIAACLEERDKLVLMAHHHDVVDALAREFPGCAVLTGRDSLEDRQKAVDRFQLVPECRLFIGSIRAAGVGLTLTAAAHVVFAELDWTPSAMTQAEDRLHRIGQRESVLVQHLVLEGSLDATMAKKLVSKQAVADAALDDAFDNTPVLPSREEGATEASSRTRITNEAALMTPEATAAVHLGLKMLAGVCDGAKALDGAGFNSMDTRIGHELARRGSLTPRQAALGRRLVNKYRRQLPDALLAAAAAKEEHDG